MKLIVRFAPVEFEVDDETAAFSHVKHLTAEELHKFVMENFLFDEDLRAGTLEIDTVEVLEPVTGVDHGRD